MADQLTTLIGVLSQIVTTIEDLSTYRSVNPRVLSAGDVDGHTYLCGALTVS